MNVVTVMLTLSTLCALGFAAVIGHGDRLERIQAEREAAASDARRYESGLQS